MKKSILVILICLLIFTGCSKEDDSLAIGIIKTIDHPTLNITYQGLVDKITDYNLQSEEPIDHFDLTIKDKKLVSQDSSNPIEMEDLDLLIAVSSQSLGELCQIETEIPIVFTAVSDFEIIKTGNKKVLTGVSDMIPIEAQLKLLNKLLPNHSTMGVIYNPQEKLSVSQIDLIKKFSSKYNLKCIYQEVDSQDQAIYAAKNMLGDIDSLYIPSDLTVTPVIKDILVWTDLANKPIITGDERGIEQGALCTVIVDYYKLGEQTGKLAIDGLTEKIELEKYPIEKSKHNKILINTEAARKLNVEIPNSLQANANF